MSDLPRILRRDILVCIHTHGTAKASAVIKKVMSAMPEYRKMGKEILGQISEMIAEIGEMSKDAASQLLATEFPDFDLKKASKPAPKRKKREDLPEIDNVRQGEAVFRFPPEPSKHPHIGHLLTFTVNGLYARRYGGKTILRYDDTNPSKVSLEYYDSWKEALDWLGFPPDEIVFASDHVDFLYEKCREFLSKNFAYACTCTREEMKAHRDERTACPHRCQSIETNLELWDKMLAKEFAVGDIVIRYLGDLESDNTALLDPVLFRISDAVHCRQGDKYVVWPTYDFESAMMEGKTGVTHVLRDANFGTMRIELQRMMLEQAGFKIPEFVQYTRYNVSGCITKGRKLREMFETGIVDDWGDPALCTYHGLRNRGIQPGIFPGIVKEVGITKSATTVDWTLISTLNKKAIDKQARRLFFVSNPWSVEIEDMPPDMSSDVVISNHPTNKELGSRSVQLASTFLIDEDDALQLKEGVTFRLKSLFNVKVVAVDSKAKTLKGAFEGMSVIKGTPIIQWVANGKECELRFPILEGINTTETTPRLRLKRGRIEDAAMSLNNGDMVQLERVGYAVMTAQRDPLRLNYTHK